MSNQVQCPSCGGYKVDGKVFRIDPSTGKPPISLGCGFIFQMILLWTFLLMVEVVLMTIIFPGDHQNTSGTIMGLVAYVLPFVVIIPFYRRQSVKINEAKKRAYNLYDYRCNLCGYNWQWREGQPRPKVKVKPGLIAKGEQRLEEEEEQRRKQQQDAAALYYLTHKK
jgi:hypothetical protein